MDDDALWAVLSGLETDVSSMRTDLVWVKRVVSALCVVAFGTQLL